MIRVYHLFIFTAVLSLAAAPAMAQEGSWGTHQGQIEVNFTSSMDSWTMDVDGEDWVFGYTYINLSAGYLVTDNIEVGAKLIIDNDSEEWQGDTADTSFSSPYVFASYNHNLESNITPYVGAGIGSSTFENEEGDTTDRTFYGPFLGVKFFVSEWAAVTAQVTYDLVTFDYPDGESYDASHLDFNVGLSVFFN